MSEEYAEKMSRKSLPELLLYVRNRAEYREDAVLAALEELERRGQPQPEAAALRAELGPIVERQAQERQSRELPPAAASTAGATASAEEPALYSPGTIVLFTMLFSFLAGGALLVINMMRLKESSKAWRVVFFILAIASLLPAFYFGGGRLLATVGPGAQYLGMGINLVAVLAYLLYFWPRYVGARPYVSRQWLPAFLVCMVLVGVYLAAMYYQLQLTR